MSSDGKISFISASYYTGTNFDITLGSSMENSVRQLLWNCGFRQVQRMNLKMKSPPDSHVFVLEYDGDPGDQWSHEIRAELVTDTKTYPLIQVGGGLYGLQDRQFAYWVLKGVTNVMMAQGHIKIYLPQNAPTALPLQQ
jgi:hypothetical protein